MAVFALQKSLVLALLGLMLSMAAPETQAREQNPLPSMRWDHRPEAAEWTLATLAVLRNEGAGLAETVPADIGAFCPAYESADLAARRAFWAGLLSALAKHESRWNPKANGGGGRWIGLMQIAPATAVAYDCDAQRPKSLKNGAENLACAVRIMAHQVVRDGAIVSDASGGWRGVARDWAPMRKADKRADMAAWTASQSYCN